MDVIDPSNGGRDLTASQGGDLSIDHPQALPAFKQLSMVAATLFHQRDLNPETNAFFVQCANVFANRSTWHSRPPSELLALHRTGKSVNDLDRFRTSWIADAGSGA
ncbi:hypothetical protein [Sphingomonas endolithica]|uniref:hypothetical protein n=1 Tax=Sphingomonas endolithica TaxID=2972485 RepID=UPI0021AE6A65|nr:hypothetical protein [Sphingomonas sp. ZFBP2030]